MSFQHVLVPTEMDPKAFTVSLTSMSATAPRAKMEELVQQRERTDTSLYFKYSRVQHSQ